MKREPPFKRDRKLAREAGRRGGQVSGVTRRAVAKQPWRRTIIELMDAAGMTGPAWLPWRAFWKAVYALPMTAEELSVFQRHTQRDTPPAEPVAEAWMVIGRGGGKTRNSALHAIYRAITFDARSVDPGTDVVIPLLASNQRQATSALKYIRAFNALPMVAPYVHRQITRTCEYRTAVDIEVVTASRNAPRGFSSPTCCCDEIAWWLTEDDHVNPDHEVLTAVRGSLARVPGSVLLVLSNPAAPKGELYEAVESYYGHDDPEVLVWNADSLSMNPTADPKAIARAFRKDPVKAASEFGTGGHVTFRQAQQALFDAEPVTAAVVTDRREIPPMSGTKYVAFVDAAQGARSGDSMTLGIAHRAGTRAVLDLVREVEPPFSPGQVIAETFAPLLHQYGCREVRGDRHAVGFVAEGFAACGIKFLPSLHTKSDLYSELLPLVNTGMVELLDQPTLRTQLLALERRSVRGGRDSIDHPRGGHDDVANAAAGALVSVTGVGAKKKKRAVFSFGDGPVGLPTQPRTLQGEAMAHVVRATKEAYRRQDERDWERAKQYEDAPMTREPIWFVHTRGG